MLIMILSFNFRIRSDVHFRIDLLKKSMQICHSILLASKCLKTKIDLFRNINANGIDFFLGSLIYENNFMLQID